MAGFALPDTIDSLRQRVGQALRDRARKRATKGRGESSTKKKKGKSLAFYTGSEVSLV